MSKAPSLSRLLKSGRFPKQPEDHAYRDELRELQLRMLRVQQGIFHDRRRAIIAFEGFDAAGKGGAIRRLTEELDPRGFQVHPIGPPEGDEKNQHYLYRFWKRLPPAGTIAIFDRTWYGRVLVERVERLAPRHRLKEAYEEINRFEKMLQDDGIDLIKIFIGISPEEQLRRFEDRLNDPYKHWKITSSDIEARRHWKDYVRATDDMFRETSTGHAPWHLVPGDDKDFARIEVLRLVTRELKHHRKSIESNSVKLERSELKKALKCLERTGS